MPWWLQALGYLAGLWVAFAVGVWFRGRRAAWDHAVDVAAIADLSGQLVDAEQAIAEYREAIPQLWQRGFEAGLHLAEFQLARTKVERDERSQAVWN
jgi:hypothetical protein